MGPPTDNRNLNSALLHSLNLTTSGLWGEEEGSLTFRICQLLLRGIGIAPSASCCLGLHFLLFVPDKLHRLCRGFLLLAGIFGSYKRTSIWCQEWHHVPAQLSGPELALAAQKLPLVMACLVLRAPGQGSCRYEGVKEGGVPDKAQVQVTWIHIISGLVYKPTITTQDLSPLPFIALICTVLS